MYKVVRGVVRGTADAAAHIVMNFPNVLKKIVISILEEGSSIFIVLRDFYTIFIITVVCGTKMFYPENAHKALM